MKHDLHGAMCRESTSPWGHGAIVGKTMDSVGCIDCLLKLEHHPHAESESIVFYEVAQSARSVIEIIK